MSARGRAPIRALRSPAGAFVVRAQPLAFPWALVCVLLGAGCGATQAGRETTTSSPASEGPFVGEAPRSSAPCEPILRFCSGAELRLGWPDDLVPFDAEVRVDGQPRDARALGAADCLAVGSHEVELAATLPVEGAYAMRRGHERLTVAEGEHLAVAAEVGAGGELALTVARVQGESVVGTGQCPILARERPAELARVVVALLPERSSRIRLLRVRASIDGVLVVDAQGADTESGEPEPTVSSGWVAPGEHVLSVEHTYGPGWVGLYAYAYSYVYRVRHVERVVVAQPGATVRVRSGDRGRVTQPIEEGIFVDVAVEPWAVGDESGALEGSAPGGGG
ncbi:MAG: hypothetical protein K1X94_24850 [Sandaracinaceae bacterium]|nr:hypothetical protein [Sandaracinaceae bacterium]